MVRRDIEGRIAAGRANRCHLYDADLAFVRQALDVRDFAFLAFFDRNFGNAVIYRPVDGR